VCRPDNHKIPFCSRSFQVLNLSVFMRGSLAQLPGLVRCQLKSLAKALELSPLKVYLGSFSMTAGPGCLLTKRSVSPVLPIYAPALVTFFATRRGCLGSTRSGRGLRYRVSQNYFRQINAAYVSNIKNAAEITTNRRALSANDRVRRSTL